MTEEQAEQSRVSGRVKWFDPVKGFGFVVSNEGGDDILLHANVLRNFGQNSVADGTRLTILVQQTARGAQAVEVLEILPPDGETAAPMEDFGDTDAATVAALPLEPARVKWFDKTKGFGFANVFGKPEDVFIHIEILRRSGLCRSAAGRSDLPAGDRRQARPDGRTDRVLGNGGARTGLMAPGHDAVGRRRHRPPAATTWSNCAGPRARRNSGSRWPMIRANAHRA